MYCLIAFNQRIVELWCHAKNFPNDPRIIGLKTLQQQGISEPVFYGDLVYIMNSKELLENLILVINAKKLSNVIKSLI